MELKKYEAFLRISENGNISRTADEMGYTQSAVTQMIRSLEQELGVVLLIRSNKGVRLTEAGRILLPIVRDELRCERRLREEAGRMNGIDSGIVNVGCLSSVAAAWMPKIIRVYTSGHPDVQVRMMENEAPELEEKLKSGVIDLAVMELMGKKKLPSHELISDEVLVVAPKDHPLAQLSAVPREKLSDYPFISYATGDTGTFEGGWPEFVTGSRIRWHVRYSCRTDMAAMQMVRSGLGITLAGGLMLRSYRNELAHLPLDPPLLRSIGVCWRSTEDLLPASRDFLDCIIDTVSEMA